MGRINSEVYYQFVKELRLVIFKNLFLSFAYRVFISIIDCFELNYLFKKTLFMIYYNVKEYEMRETNILMTVRILIQLMSTYSFFAVNVDN